MADIDIAAIIVAIISLVSSVIVAVITYIFNNRHDREIESLKNSLEIQKDERAAIRDYEYDARKRLYQEFEPLLFQLVEHSDSALFRIKRLASTAKEGNLKRTSGWLSGPGYFTFSTIYKLLLPLAVFKLMQHKLTIFDLDLVTSYKTQYLLAKGLYFTFSDDFELAQELRYDPEPPPNYNIEQWQAKVSENPERYMKQGIYTGIIDNLVEGLIEDRPSAGVTIARLRTFNEFQQMYVKTDPNSRRRVMAPPFDYMVDLLKNFHPGSRPILWRIFLAQAHIYQAIKRTREMPKSATTFKTLSMMTKDEREQYDWRHLGSNYTDYEVFAQPFNAVERYFQKSDILGQILEIGNHLDTSKIINWNTVLFKYVRSKDMNDIGYVAHVEDNSIIIMNGRHKFKLPKSSVEGYNGSELYSNVSIQELQAYEIEVS